MRNLVDQPNYTIQSTLPRTILFNWVKLIQNANYVFWRWLMDRTIVLRIVSLILRNILSKIKSLLTHLLSVLIVKDSKISPLLQAENAILPETYNKAWNSLNNKLSSVSGLGLKNNLNLTYQFSNYLKMLSSSHLTKSTVFTSSTPPKIKLLELQESNFQRNSRTNNKRRK